MFDKLFASKNKRVIYTSLFGDIDELKNPVSVIPKTDYVVFTNEKKNNKTWRQSIQDCNQNGRRCARRYKIIFDPKYEYSIYCDASFEIHLDSWEEILDSIEGNKEFALTIHPDRNCLYDEGEVCIDLQRDDKNVIEKQLERYRNEGMPVNYGLWASGIILRKNTPKVIELCHQWWEEIQNGSIRDQISLPYIFWKNNYEPGIFPGGNVWENKYFKYIAHPRPIL